MPPYYQSKFTKERARAIFILFILGLLARLYMGGTTKTSTMRDLRLCVLKRDQKAC